MGMERLENVEPHGFKTNQDFLKEHDVVEEVAPSKEVKNDRKSEDDAEKKKKMKKPVSTKVLTDKGKEEGKGELFDEEG